MSKLIHLPERADALPPGQFAVTEFVFDVFKRKPSWDNRDGVMCSLLRAAVFPEPKDSDILRYEPFICASAPLTGLHMVDNAADANDVIFRDVGIENLENRVMVVGLLIHDRDRKPIAHIGHAAGLPLWTNGGDIIVTWDNGANRIFRICS